MNDIKFIETLKQKRNACDYSQSRLAQDEYSTHSEPHRPALRATYSII